MKDLKLNARSIRVKLIFNPGSGENNQSPGQLLAVIMELQASGLLPEIYLIEPDCDLPAVIEEASSQGILLFVVCGGDGTVASVASALVGKDAVLGIVPTGTQNNIALSLNIPSDIPGAVSVIKAGHQIQADAGVVTCGGNSKPFVEVCTVGLLSSIFPSADDIQHGNLGRIGDFLASLTTTPPSEITLQLDDQPVIREVGHVVLVSNTPYVGRNYQVGSPDAMADGLLDVSLYSNLNKLDLLGYILTEPGTDTTEDPRIRHFKGHSIVIDGDPAMAVMVDGIPFGEGTVRIEVMPGALAVIAGVPMEDKSGEALE